MEQVRDRLTQTGIRLDLPFRVLDFVYNAEMDTYPMAKVVETCRRMSANVIHFHCMSNMAGGLDEDGMYFRARCDGSGYHNFSETFEQQLQNACP